jgi:hypothetical protein
MRYPWPEGKQSAAVLSFDFDAESGFLFREPEKAKRSLGDLEERRFGPRVGVDRILAGRSPTTGRPAGASATPATRSARMATSTRRSACSTRRRRRR